MTKLYSIIFDWKGILYDPDSFTLIDGAVKNLKMKVKSQIIRLIVYLT